MPPYLQIINNWHTDAMWGSDDQVLEHPIPKNNRSGMNARRLVTHGLNVLDIAAEVLGGLAFAVELEHA